MINYIHCQLNENAMLNVNKTMVIKTSPQAWCQKNRCNLLKEARFSTFRGILPLKIKLLYICIPTLLFLFFPNDHYFKWAADWWKKMKIFISTVTIKRCFFVFYSFYFPSVLQCALEYQPSSKTSLPLFTCPLLNL